jgi:hypothetical protein
VCCVRNDLWAHNKHSHLAHRLTETECSVSLIAAMTFGRIIAPAACINGHDGGANLRSLSLCLFGPAQFKHSSLSHSTHTARARARERLIIPSLQIHTHTHVVTNYTVLDTMQLGLGFAITASIDGAARPLCLGSPPVIPARVMKDWAPKAPPSLLVPLF